MSARATISPPGRFAWPLANSNGTRRAMLNSPTSGVASPSKCGAVFLASLCVFAAPLLPLAPIGTHMALHIATMNVAALVCAAATLPKEELPTTRCPPRGLWWLTALQMLLLWAWHAPPAHAVAESSALLYGVMTMCLFIVAFGFWRAILLRARRADWQPIFALLITGKLACLLGALLVFAPRAIYDHAELTYPTMCFGGSSQIEDQHLAGLLMLTACPVSYVLAGVILAARIINQLSEPRLPRRPTLAEGC